MYLLLEKREIKYQTVNSKISKIIEGRGGYNYYFNNNKYISDDELNLERYTNKIKINDSISIDKLNIEIYRNQNLIYKSKIK